MIKGKTMPNGALGLTGKAHGCKPLSFEELKKRTRCGDLLKVRSYSGGAKIFRTSRRWSILLDRSRTFYRVQNPNGEYTDKFGNPQGGLSDKEFERKSTFKTISYKPFFEGWI